MTTFDNLPAAIDQMQQDISELKQLLKTPQHSEEDRWLNIKQLSEYHPKRPSINTIYGWTSKRLIPFHKHGKALLFLKSEIDAMLKQTRKKTLAELHEQK